MMRGKMSDPHTADQKDREILKSDTFSAVNQSKVLPALLLCRLCIPQRLKSHYLFIRKTETRGESLSISLHHHHSDAAEQGNFWNTS